MKVFLYFLLLLSVTTLVGAQTPSGEPEAAANRPLNLSVRRPTAPVTDAQVTVLPLAPGAAAALPYGAGFERRQQSSGAGNGVGDGAGNGAGSSSGNGADGSGSSGNGGGGRGGSGRGR